MQKIKNIYILAFGLLSSGLVLAQEATPNKPYDQGQTKFTLSYSYGLPMGDFKNIFINKPSVLGANIDIMHFVKPSLAVGGGIGYQDFYEKKARQTFPQNDGSDISGVLSNSLQTIPILAKAQFYPFLNNAQMRLMPYVQGGAGVNLISYQQYVGIFSNYSELVIKPAFQGGIGVRYPFGKEMQNGIVASANYNYMPFNKIKINQVSQLNFQIGLHLRLRNDGGNTSDRFRQGPGSDRYRPNRRW